MKVSIVAIAIAATLVSGCAHVPAPRTFEATRLGIAGRSGEIARVGGVVVSGHAIHVSRASVSWTNPHTGSRESVPTTMVDEIRIPRRSRGALRGFGSGCLAGGLIGAVLGHTNIKCSNTENLTTDNQCRVFGAVVVGVSLGCAGGLIGGLLGIVLDKDVYPVRRLLESASEGVDTNDER